MSEFQITKCPVCRARLQGTEPLQQPCHRCQSDLQHIRATCVQAQYWQQQARLALLQQQPQSAIIAARKAVFYSNTPSTRQTFVASVLAAYLDSDSSDPSPQSWEEPSP